MKIDDLIADIGRQVQVKNDVIDTLRKHAQDPDQSARLAFALLEIGIDAFRHAGMGPFLVMALCQMIAHGATTETALKALMAVHEEDDLLDQHDPSRKEKREHMHGGKKHRVM
ncbi:MAG: hypothetical protein ABWY78_06380 [Microvirga sp.]